MEGFFHWKSTDMNGQKEFKLFCLTLVSCIGIILGCEGFPALRPGDVDVVIRTEKQEYRQFEPVFLEIAICNLLDKQICVHVGRYLQQYFHLTVLDPYRPQKVVPGIIQTEHSVEELVIPEHLPEPVPLTRAGLRPPFNQGWRECVISPHGKHIIQIPLSHWFDLSYPLGEYTVNIKVNLLGWDFSHNENQTKTLVIEKSCAFEIKEELQSARQGLPGK